MLFAFARDGRLPSILGRVHPRTHAPHVAIMVYALVAIGLVMVFSASSVAAYTTYHDNAYFLKHQLVYLAAGRVALAGEPLNFPWLRVAMLIGIFSMAALIALASREEIIGLAIALAVSVVLYWLSNRRLSVQG